MLNNLTIILVEDSETDRILFEKYLSFLGYKSQCLNSGTTLIEQMHTLDPSVILLDIEMPGINGLETAKIIRQKEKSDNTKHVVIALTAHTDAIMMGKIAEAGFDDCIQKPITKHDLELKIRQYTAAVNPACSPELAPDTGIEEGTKLYNLEMFKGEDPDFVQSIVELFVTKTPQSIADLKSAFLTNDQENLRQIAHKLKPLFSFFGNTKLQQVLQCIEDIAGGKTTHEKLPYLIECIEENGRILVAQMKEDLMNIGKNQED